MAASHDEQPFLLDAERELDLTPYEVHDEQIIPPPTLMNRIHADLLRGVAWAALISVMWLFVVAIFVLWLGR